MKTQAASKKQLEDIRILREYGRVDKLDDKLKEVILLREEFEEASLQELAAIYEERSGNVVSKSGMKHRFNRIHELAEKIKK